MVSGNEVESYRHRLYNSIGFGLAVLSVQRTPLKL